MPQWWEFQKIKQDEKVDVAMVKQHSPNGHIFAVFLIDITPLTFRYFSPSTVGSNFKRSSLSFIGCQIFCVQCLLTVGTRI